jgi:hypothetical protein
MLLNLSPCSASLNYPEPHPYLLSYRNRILQQINYISVGCNNTRPPLWSSDQSFWLQIQRSRVRFQTLPDFQTSSGLERDSLSLMSTIEQLLGRNISGSGLENREYGHVNPLRLPREILYPQKLVITSTTSGGRSAYIVRLRTKATELVILF